MNKKQREAGAKAVHGLVAEVMADVAASLLGVGSSITDEVARGYTFGYAKQILPLCADWEHATDHMKEIAFEEFDKIEKATHL